MLKKGSYLLTVVNYCHIDIRLAGRVAQAAILRPFFSSRMRTSFSVQTRGKKRRKERERWTEVWQRNRGNFGCSTGITVLISGDDNDSRPRSSLHGMFSFAFVVTVAHSLLSPPLWDSLVSNDTKSCSFHFLPIYLGFGRINLQTIDPQSVMKWCLLCGLHFGFSWCVREATLWL